jgi:serine/threonine protein kinase
MTGPLEKGALLSGRYEITGFLGAGGFASVYLGFDTLIQREVAIKVLEILDKLPDPSQRQYLLERFYNEARLSARIRHDNIVNIYDMGVLGDGDRPFIVMERLHGHDLEHELIQHGPLAPARAVRLFARCLDALAAGHEQGIIHKDLKPSNLFLIEPNTERENVRVLDFGIARLIDSDARLTSTNQMIGTAQYLAPEYIHHKEVSPALDIYQMGLILAELLTGDPVVDESNPLACVVIHSKGQLQVPAAILQSPLGPIITRATAYKPIERYASARQMRQALEQALPLVEGLPPLQLAAPAPSLPEIEIDRGALGPPSTVFSEDGFLDPPSDETIDPPAPEGPSVTAPVAPEDLQPRPRAARAAPAPTQLTLAPPPAPPQVAPDAAPRRNAIFLLGGLALASAALVVGVALSQEKDPAPTPAPASAVKPTPDPAPEPDPAPPAPDLALAAAPDLSPAPEADAAPDAPVEAAQIEVQLHSDPEGAVAYEGKVRLGPTPLPLRFDGADGGARRVQLRKDGFAPLTITIQAADAPRRDVTLKPRAAKGEQGGEGGLIPD